MVTDHLCRIGWRSPPRSFVSLMTLYESNYIRLGWLIPDLQTLSSHEVSRAPDDVNLHLKILERSPYTLLLHLTYQLAGTADESAPLAVPDMQMRVYHDARLAEACSCSDSPMRGPLRRLGEALRGELDRRWARNMLLNKWLEYCVERGHRFPG